jgi:hypothetical protein
MELAVPPLNSATFGRSRSWMTVISFVAHYVSFFIILYFGSLDFVCILERRLNRIRLSALKRVCM